MNKQPVGSLDKNNEKTEFEKMKMINLVFPYK
jgi:hypothetical protein